MKIPIDDCPAGPELDAAAAEAMGWIQSTDGYWIYHDGKLTGYRHRSVFMDDSPYFKPSRNDNATLALVDTMPNRAFLLSYGTNGEWIASFWHLTAKCFIESFDRIRPLAIARAFCKAHGITQIEVPDAEA